MAADLHIHALTERCTEQHVRRMAGGVRVGHAGSESSWDEAISAVTDTPQFWVCEVSWLKAALFADNATYVPSVAELVTEAIGRDFPVLDDALVERLTLAMFGPQTTNVTSYATVEPERLEAWTKFCTENRGRKIFHVSW